MFNFISHSKRLHMLILSVPLAAACNSAPKPPMPSGSRVPVNTGAAISVERANPKSAKNEIETLRAEIASLQKQVKQLQEELETADALRLSAGALSSQGSGIAPAEVIESKPLKEKETSNKKDYTPRQAYVIETLHEHIATLVRS